MIERRTASIAASSTTSTEITLNGALVCGIYIPKGFTGTAISFLASVISGGETFRVADGEGNAYSLTCAAGDYVPLEPSIFAGIDFLKVVSGSTESTLRYLMIATREG